MKILRPIPDRGGSVAANTEVFACATLSRP